MSRKCPGMFQVISSICSKHARFLSEMFEECPAKYPVTFRDMCGTYPVTVKEMPEQKFPQNIQKTSVNSPGNVREIYSETVQEAMGFSQRLLFKRFEDFVNQNFHYVMSLCIVQLSYNPLPLLPVEVQRCMHQYLIGRNIKTQQVELKVQ